MGTNELDRDIVKLVPGYIDLETSKELKQHFITDQPISPTISDMYLSKFLNISLFKYDNREHSF